MTPITRFKAPAASTESATWVRIFTPPAEGLLVSGDFNLDVGAKIRVKLVSTNVERGFIDFEQSH